MKNLKCDKCEATAPGNTVEEAAQALHPHYMEAHPEVMNDPNMTEEDKAKWMAEAKIRFDEAENI